MDVSANERSWLSVLASSLACAAGALIVYSDLFTKRIRRCRDFRIASSDAFLSASLSLSAGVMLFSSVYTILPIARQYIVQEGYSARLATSVQSGLFVLGIVAVRVLSTISHYIGLHAHPDLKPQQHDYDDFEYAKFESGLDRGDTKVSYLRGTPRLCVEHRTAEADTYEPLLSNRRSALQTERAEVGVVTYSTLEYAGQGLQNELEAQKSFPRFSCCQIPPSTNELCTQDETGNFRAEVIRDDLSDTQIAEVVASDQNSFTSIGLQTSIAVAVHKLPEGFILFTSNSTNTELGTAVFISLFVHNVVEGFIVSLSLYMALRSRARAVLWALLIGCLSQPLGAVMAVLWMRVIESPDKAVLGSLYAFTAGIMTSLSFSLYTKALLLTLRDTWCSSFVFLGMAVLGCTNSLIAK